MLTRRQGVLLGSVALGIAVVTAIVLVFVPGALSARLQAELGQRLQADVSWEGAGLNLVRDFPRARLTLRGLVVTDTSAAERAVVARVDRLRLSLDVGSVLRGVRGTGPIEVVQLHLDEPYVRFVVHEDGSTNWDGLQREAVAEPTRPSSAALRLRRFRVRGGALDFRNAAAGIVARLDGVDQDLSGDFASARFRLETDVNVAAADLIVADLGYLKRTRVGVRGSFDVDRAAGRIGVGEAELRLNELRLALSGSVDTGERGSIDLAFDSPGGTFGEIASLVPALATEAWQAARSEGTLAASGWVRGAYGGGTFPAFAAAVRVRDGTLQHADMPLAVRGVTADLDIANPGGDADSTRIELRRLSLIVGTHPLQGSATIRTPVSGPSIATHVTGALDLAELARTFPMEGVEESAGRVHADVAASFRLADLDEGRYDRVTLEGAISGDALRYRSAQLAQGLGIDELRLALSPARGELASLRGVIGRSDFAATGSVENLLGFLVRDQELRGRVRVASRRFDLDEWRSDDETRAVPVPARIDMTLDGRADHVSFADLELRAVHGTLRIRDQRASLEDLRFETLGGALAVTGYYETLIAERPTFDVALTVTGVEAAQAAAALPTFGALAPAARYATGRFSTEVRLSGGLDADLVPNFNELIGRGTFETFDFAIDDFPGLERLADALGIEQLRRPTMIDVRSTFSIVDGRVHVSPFAVRLGTIDMTVSGSHGLDETLDYRLTLQVPAPLLTAASSSAMGQAFAAQAGRLGIETQAVAHVPVTALLTGSVGSPALGLDLGRIDVAAAVAGVRGDAVHRLDEAGQQAAEAAAEAQRRLDEERARRIAEAEARAAALLAEAEQLADGVRRQADAQADALVAEAGNPLARRAAETAAARIRREADQRAAALVREAEARGHALLEEAARPPS
jgi:hypothetical protein